MKSTSATAFLSALLLLIPACIAGDTQTQEYCATLKSTKPVKSILTATKAHTVTFERFQIVNYTPVTTVTLPAATSTTTIVTTQVLTSTLPTGTSTIDITSTILETDTLTEPTQTSTFFSSFTTTITTTSGTSTIAAPSGFVPAESSFPGSGGPVKRRSIRGATNARNIFGQDKGLCLPFGKGRPTYYPTEVICSELVEVYKIFTQTYTARKTTTVTAKQSTSTISSTSTITSTSLVNPVSASLISTILSTSTISTTLYPSTSVTLSTTSTVTNVIPAATFYAACGTDNLVYSDNGNSVLAAISNNIPAVHFGGDGATTAYDCCVSCQQDPTCAAGFFDDSCGTFLLSSESTCSAPNEYTLRADFVSSGSFADNGAVFNGVCGEYTGSIS